MACLLVDTVSGLGFERQEIFTVQKLNHKLSIGEFLQTIRFLTSIDSGKTTSSSTLQKIAIKKLSPTR